MVVDKKTNRGEFGIFPLDFTNEKCMEKYGLTLDEYDDVLGYLAPEERSQFLFLYEASKGHPQRQEGLQHAKESMLKSIQKRKDMMK